MARMDSSGYLLGRVSGFSWAGQALLVDKDRLVRGGHAVSAGTVRLFSLL